jgi:nicotinate-nucleotide--dimethylbenzimidazole phosphoribosyltransferase
MSHEAHRAVLVLGGIRSGKSEYAESLVGSATEVRYVATAAPLDAYDEAGSAASDATRDPVQSPEWAARIAAHRARRPDAWLTEETGTAPERLAELVADTKPDQTVLVDDLGGWVAAHASGPDSSGPDSSGADPAALATAVRDCAGRVILVSPEVGLSVVPATAAGVAFADALGTVNRALAQVCDLVVLVVAGQPVVLKRGVPGTRVVSRPAVAAASVVAPVVAAVMPDVTATGDDAIVIEPGMSLPVPDQQASVTATERLAGLDVAGSGLGRLAEVVGFAAGAQGTDDPGPYRSVRVLVLHGVHAGGLAEGDDPQDWARRFGDLAQGGGPLGLLAGQAGVSVQVADLGAAGLPVAGPVESDDALDADGVEAALRYGWRLADSATDSGVDLLLLGAGGPGQEAAAVALIAALTGVEAPGILPRVRRAGGTYDDLAWMARMAAIRDALHRANWRTRDPKDALAALGGTGIATAVGVLLGACARRTPVVVDGPVGVAAGLIARELATQSRLWLLLADDGGHPATRAGADRLGLTPVADLGMGLGEGAGGLTALPLIQSALLLASGATGPKLSTVDSLGEDTSLADPDTIRA